jgi:hypothetical protein
MRRGLSSRGETPPASYARDERALALAAAGSLLGVLLAQALGKTLASLLFGVTATDPATIGAVVLLLLAVALALPKLPSVPGSRVVKRPPARRSSLYSTGGGLSGSGISALPFLPKK